MLISQTSMRTGQLELLFKSPLVKVVSLVKENDFEEMF